MAETDNHSFIKQAWPDLDSVIQFLPADHGIWATCMLCGTGLRGYGVIAATARNARRHLDEHHPGWAGLDAPEGQATA